MSFSSLRVSYFIPDFVEIQRKSFLDLLDKGLIQELYKRNPITNITQNLELIFYPEYYKLNPPDWTPKEAILKSKTYACRLYVPIQLTNKATKEIKVQWVLLGNLPLMTKRGHFILNGSPRVIVNQMVRSPGIYYQEVFDKNKVRTYYADLISHRGAWLRLETDKKRKVWARMKKTPKVSILVFLQALGLSKEKIFQSINYSNFLKFSFLKEDHPSSSDQALRSLYFKIHPKKDESEITPNLGQKFLSRKFFNSRTYDLSQLGRMQLNKKLGLSIPLSKSILTEQDILFATDYLIKLEYGLGTLDDIDDLKNRRVRASGELIQNQLGTGFIRLEKMIREKLKKPRKKLTVRNLITTKPVNGALREFFGSSQLSQFMDQTNPLAELTHKRRLSSLGPGGISRETAGMAVRGIHPSHYGRICPIETPEGPNAGLVNSLTTHAKVNSGGFIETPFYSVYKGQIQTSTGPIFFSAAREDNVTIAPGDLKSSQLDFLPEGTVPVRATKEFKKIIRNEVEYISISPIQMISIATSLIPFLEHDDANRALMGSNMQRQAVPLIAPERPIVGTGLEGRVTADSGHAIQSRTSGFVSYVSGEKIIIKNCIEPTLQRKSVSSQILKFPKRDPRSQPRFRLAKTSTTASLSKQVNVINLVSSGLRGSNPVSSKVKNNPLFQGVQLFTPRDMQVNLDNLTTNQVGSLGKNLVSTSYKPWKTESFELIQTLPLRGELVHSSNDQLLAFNRFQNNKNAKSQYNLSPGSLKVNTSPLKTDIVLKKSSVLQIFFNCIGREFNEINFAKYRKFNQKELFNKKNKIVPVLRNSKQSPSFNFLTIKDLTTNQLTKKVYFSTRINPTQPLSYNNNNYQDNTTKGSFILEKVEKINFPNYSLPTISAHSIFSKVQKPLPRSDWNFGIYIGKTFEDKANQDRLQASPKGNLHHKPLVCDLEKTILNLRLRDKNVSKQQRSFKQSTFNYYTKKTFLIKKNILKLDSTNKFNWFYFISLYLLDNKSSSNNILDRMSKVYAEHKQDFPVGFRGAIEDRNHVSASRKPLLGETVAWKTLSNLSCPQVQGWNKSYRLPKLDFLDISPYSFKTIGYLSYLEYFTNLELPFLLANDQTSLPNRGQRFVQSTNQVYSPQLKTKFLTKSCLADKAWGKQPPIINPTNNAVSSLSSRSDKSFRPQLKPLTTNSSTEEISLNNTNKFNIEKNFSLSSIDYPLAEYQRSNQDTCVAQRPIVHEGDWIQRGDLLADGTASVGGELALGKTILVAYMPWEGYNFEDAILISERLIYNDLYTSIHIERYEIEIRDTKFGVEQITNEIPEIDVSEMLHLDTRGIAKLGSWIKEGDILVGKITPIQKKSLSPHEKLLYDIVKKEIPTTRDTSLRVPKNVHGRVINIQILETENIPTEIDFEGPGRVHIYIAEKRKIQVGDKMAGRHGNKGIISKILPRQDMPYLPDGTPIDMVLNPLGVPSRMNVGQIFECLLGLAGKQLDQQFKIIPFDEIYGPEASRSLVYSKLFEARMKTGQKWLFDPNFAGKTKLFDGRTGESFDQAVTVGQAYMLKLVHLVDEKIHARSTGPYSLVTQQPLRGRSKQGGQRLGEMEVWALEGFGAAYTLQELLTVKSDDMKGRHQVMDAILNNRPISLGTPESFKVLIRELQSLCLDVGVFTIQSPGPRRLIDVMTLA